MKVTAARVAAFGVAALAVADPAVTSSRSSRPIVSVVAGDGFTAPGLSERVTDVLDRKFTVVRGLLDGAAAIVLVGQRVPDELMKRHSPVVAVLPSARRQAIRLVNVHVPASAPLHVRIPVEITIEARGARGREVAVQLRSDNLIVAEKRLGVDSDSARLTAILHYVAPDAGAHVIQTEVRLEGTTAADSALSVVAVREDRIRVLFHDPRPSWASTFVRRAVERDPRFSVSHRILTSRGLSNSAGPAPVSLRDAGRLERFGAVVIGAPDQLTDADAAGLEEFMRRNGGRVVLLLDRSSGRAIERLTGVSRWSSTRLEAAAPITDPQGAQVLRGRELVWPAELPAVAELHAASVARDSTRRPILWSVPAGAGRLLVSGALDAWHHRDAASGFDAYWTTGLANLAAGKAAPIEIELNPAALAPGQSASVRVTLRDAFLSTQDIRTSRISARLTSEVGDSSAIRLWPDAMPGVFVGTIVAPRQEGEYRLAVSTASDSASAPIVVDAGARHPDDDDRQVIEAFVSSRGGFVASEDDLGALPGRLSSAMRAVPRVEIWHPMRSPWWIVPFALLLGVEWWWRRRRGLP